MNKIIIFVILTIVIISGCVNTGSDNSSTIDNNQNSAASTSPAIPISVQNNCIGFVIGSPDEISTVNTIGAGWVRPHPGPFIWQQIEKTESNFNFIETDIWVEKAQENNVAILATVFPYADWDQEKCRTSECQVTKEDIFYSDIPKYRCVPCNMDTYKYFLGRLVERYDGDGTDDMPRLKIPIKYWEILNEPEMNSPELTFYKGNKEGYYNILKTSSEVIHQTCPDCKVVQAGAAGIQASMLTYWTDIFKLGAGNYFDIANIHYINNGDLANLNVQEFKNIMTQNQINQPLWVTEAEYTSADQVVNSLKGALEAGAAKVFFTRFEVGKNGPPTPGVYSDAYKGITSYCK